MNIAVIDDDGGQHGTVFTVLFWIILTLASAFSGFTTYLGFSADLPDYMSVPIAVMIGLGLFGINWQLREESKKHERSLIAPLIVFAVVFVFSFVSNTNAFYSRFVEDDIVRETQEDAYDVFEAGSRKAIQVIENDPVYQREIADMGRIEGELANLKRQIIDPRNPGMGQLAQEHLAEIERLLDGKVTPLQPPSSSRPLAEHQAYANALEEQVREQMKERWSDGVRMMVTGVHEEVETMRATHLQRLMDQDFNRIYTDEMRRDLVSIENRINESFEPTPPLDLEEINDRADEVGKFKNTWRNFVDLVSPVAMALSIVLGALLDLLAPFMTLAFRPRD